MRRREFITIMGASSIYRIASGEDIAAAIDMAHASRSAALNVLASPLLWAYRRVIMDRAAVLRLPAMYRTSLPSRRNDEGNLLRFLLLRLHSDPLQCLRRFYSYREPRFRIRVARECGSWGWRAI
jgi:hypothetical protein